MTARRGLVLMYHRLGPGLLADEGDYAVPPELFDAHLQVLVRSGRPVLSLDRLLTADFPEGAVWLTFDDGRESDATEAAPRLLRHGFSAAFFVNPALCGTPGNASFSQLREMVRAGFTVGSHGLDHTLLDDLPEAEARRQIFDSKRLLEDGLGHPVRALSLPGGTGGERARRLAEAAGYDLVLGSRPAPVRGAERGRIAPRFAVRLKHSPERFAALLEAGELTWLAHAARFEAAQGARHLLGGGAYGRLRLLWLGTRAGGDRG